METDCQNARLSISGEGHSMRVGIQFFPDVGPEVKSARDYWREALHLVGLVDRYGYHHVRTVEHYFHPYGGYSPNPIVFLAAAAQVTRNARLVTGAVLPAFNHPLSVELSINSRMYPSGFLLILPFPSFA